MGSLTLANILDATLQGAGFVKFSSYVGSSSAGALQMIALANDAANALRRYDWNALRVRTTQALTTGTDTYALPTGFWYYVPDTMYKDNSTNIAQLPTSPQEWAYIKASDGSGRGPNYRVRFMRTSSTDAAGVLHVDGATTGDTLAYEYVDSRPIRATGAAPYTFKERFTADSDIWLLDDELIVKDMRWRFKQAKGMPWQPDYNDWKNYATHRQGTDNGARVIRMGTGTDNYMPSPPYANLYV